MIDPATGMKPGERYAVDNLERVHPFTGFFLDGKYYLGPELLTAVGWLEGRRFIYDNLDATGEPVFANRIAGEIKDLVLTLADGTPLAVSRLEHWPPDEGAGEVEQPGQRPSTPEAPAFAAVQGRRLLAGVERLQRHPAAILATALALGFVAGWVLAALERKRQ
ncbi:short chain dehydrogenase [Pseudomonas sp. CCOS 191]|nr:short chain dehydrogenase [Pseudomonas sp. CCOS 191]